MNTQNNQIILKGRMASGFEFSHENHEEKFFRFIMETERISGTKDYLPILVSERLIDSETTYENNPICVVGQVRSYNLADGDKKHLILNVFALDLYISEEQDDTNELYLDGYICKNPTFRLTPSGRQISDLLIAVNRVCGKSDYIPCVTWGRDANLASRLDVGTRIAFVGRLQSREYQKVIDGVPESRTTYEISVGRIETYE